MLENSIQSSTEPLSDRICPVCDKRDFFSLYKTRDRHYGNKEMFDVIECRYCGLRSISPMPTEEEMRKYYPKDFYAYQPVLKESKIRQFLRRFLLMRIMTIEPKFGSQGRMLDVGCGTGTILETYKNKGWSVHGVEPSSSACEIGNRKGLNIHCGTLISANYQDKYFDYVRLNHSFEHIVNPNEVLQEIFRILKGNGILFIGVPNVEGINSKIFGKYWWYLGVPVHSYGYSTRNISSILEKNGFMVDLIRYNSDYSGIAGSIQIWLNRKSEKLSSQGWFIQNKVLVVICQRMAKLIDMFSMGDAIEVTARKKC